MTRNQMIGAGCGGAGCLGLFVLVLVGAFFYWSSRTPSESHSVNTNSSRMSDRNSNSTNSAPGSATSLSDDNRHKLFQAASATHDSELLKRVNKKLGLVDADGAPTKTYGEFLKDHIVWIFKNSDWISEHNTPEKGRAYVNEHIND